MLAIFSNAAPHQTSVRIVVTGGWQRLQATGGGGKGGTDFGMVGGVQMSATPEEYKGLLDLIEAGLLSESRLHEAAQDRLISRAPTAAVCSCARRSW